MTDDAATVREALAMGGLSSSFQDVELAAHEALDRLAAQAARADELEAEEQARTDQTFGPGYISPITKVIQLRDELTVQAARADRYEEALRVILHASWEAPEDWANIHRVAREALNAKTPDA